MSVDHELMSRTHVQFPLPGETSQVDTAIRLFKLARIVGTTLEGLYTTTQRRGGVAKIAHLQAELDAWARVNEGASPEIDNADVSTMTSNASVSTDQSLATLYLKVSHNVATVHVHRPALAFTTAHPQYAASLKACGQASADLIRLLAHGLVGNESPFEYLDPSLKAQSQAKPWPEALTALLLYPNGVHMLWQAGLTVIFSRLKGHHITQDQDEVLIFSCIEALRYLQSHADDVGGHVSQCADVLDLLRTKVFSDTQIPPELDHLQWNIWDWPLESALELANTLNTAPLDLHPNSEEW